MADVRNMAGAGGKGKRQKHDFYASAPHTIRDLLSKEDFDEGLIWECACGNGKMSKELERQLDKERIISSDLIDRGFGEGGVDFLKSNDRKEFIKNRDIKHIITNPPYKDGKEFVEEALKVVNSKVAFLLKLSFLESQKRYELFQNTPLKKVYVYCKRPKIWKNDKPRKNGGLLAYAWFVWEKGYTGQAAIEWIKNK